MQTRKPVRFVLVGVAALLVSVVVYWLVLTATRNAWLATWVRMGVVIPMLYLGYSRVVLIETLRTEQVRYGFWSSEGRMAARVVGALGASILIKVAFEPLLTGWMLVHVHQLVWLVPVASDLLIGPAANFAVLEFSSRRTETVEVSVPTMEGD